MAELIAPMCSHTTTRKADKRHWADAWSGLKLFIEQSVGRDLDREDAQQLSFKVFNDVSV